MVSYSIWTTLQSSVSRNERSLAVLAVSRPRAWDGAWLVLAASGMLGWTLAAVAVAAAQRAAMPPPPPVRPMVHVVMDRTVCDATLPKNGFIAGKEDGFGIFERWILRLGYFTSRREGPAVFCGDLVVFLYPNQPIPDDFRDRLVEYVVAGGEILVVDSPKNDGSTAGDLLQPFGLSVGPSVAQGGPLRTSAGWPAAAVEPASRVAGGKPFAWVGEDPVGANLRHGQGSVTVAGFGSRFTDAKMGVTGDVEPNDDLRQVFELQFSMLRAIIAGEMPGE